VRTRKHCALPFIANFYSKPGQPQVQISFLFILSVHSQFTLSFSRPILTVFEVKSIFSTNFRSFPDFCFGLLCTFLYLSAEKPQCDSS
jgi:hypothetical protein